MNLIEGLHSEMNRVREIIKEYEHPSLNGAGIIATTMMKADIKNAERAIAEGDIVQELFAYKKLQSYTL